MSKDFMLQFGQSMSLTDGVNKLGFVRTRTKWKGSIKIMSYYLGARACVQLQLHEEAIHWWRKGPAVSL